MKRMQEIDFRKTWGDVPPAFAARMDLTLRRLQNTEKERKPMKKTSIALVLVCALLAMATVAIAATLSHTADFFGRFYGPEFQAKLEGGTTIPREQSATMKGASFSFYDAVIVEEEAEWLTEEDRAQGKTFGLYAAGRIIPDGNVVLMAQDEYTVNDPAGYPLIYKGMGPTPPADAPSYAELAQAKNAPIRLVNCIPNGILDENGEPLPNDLGYTLIPQPDGSVLFSVEIYPVKAQDEYELSLYIAVTDVAPDGTILNDTKTHMDWVVTLTPEKAE